MGLEDWLRKWRRRGLTFPGYRYLGPFNDLNSGEPINELDEAAMRHDYEYARLGTRAYYYWNSADEKFLEDIKEIDSTEAYVARQFFEEKAKLFPRLRNGKRKLSPITEEQDAAAKKGRVAKTISKKMPKSKGPKGSGKKGAKKRKTKSKKKNMSLKKLKKSFKNSVKALIRNSKWEGPFQKKELRVSMLSVAENSRAWGYWVFNARTDTDALIGALGRYAYNSAGTAWNIITNDDGAGTNLVNASDKYKIRCRHKVKFYNEQDTGIVLSVYKVIYNDDNSVTPTLWVSNAADASGTSIGTAATSEDLTVHFQLSDARKLYKQFDKNLRIKHVFTTTLNAGESRNVEYRHTFIRQYRNTSETYLQNESGGYLYSIYGTHGVAATGGVSGYLAGTINLLIRENYDIYVKPQSGFNQEIKYDNDTLGTGLQEVGFNNEFNT